MLSFQLSLSRPNHVSKFSLQLLSYICSRCFNLTELTEEGSYTCFRCPLSISQQSVHEGSGTSCFWSLNFSFSELILADSRTIFFLLYGFYQFKSLSSAWKKAISYDSGIKKKKIEFRSHPEIF